VHIGLEETTEDDKSKKSQEPAYCMAWFIKKQRTQGADQCPQNDRTAIDKPAQRDHEQKRQEQDQDKLAESKEVILACPCKAEDTQQRKDAIGKWNRARPWLAEEEVQQAPGKPCDHEGKSTYHQQGFLQTDVIVVVGVRTNEGYEWKRPLNKIPDQLIASFKYILLVSAAITVNELLLRSKRSVMGFVRAAHQVKTHAKFVVQAL
jgi:hypothetical protein